MFPKNPNVVADMTAMHHIHEPGILHNLKERSRPWRQTPYTFMVSKQATARCANPYGACPANKQQQDVQTHMGLAPHTFIVSKTSNSRV